MFTNKQTNKPINKPDTVGNIDFVELVDELVAAVQPVELNAAVDVVAAVVAATVVVELVVAYKHCNCMFVHVNYLPAE